MSPVKHSPRWSSLISLGLLAAFLLAACQPKTITPLVKSTRTPPATKTPYRTPTRYVPGSPSSVVSLPTADGANGGTPSAGNATPTPSARITVGPEDLKGITLTFWHPWDGAVQNEVEALADEFNRTNSYEIKVNVYSAGGKEALLENLTNPPPDTKPAQVIAATTEQLFALNASGAYPLLNLDDYANDAKWGLSSQEIADFPLVFWRQDVDGQKRLGIPAQRSIQVMFYNQTWAQELGFNQPPTTFEDFEKQACAAAKTNKKDKDRTKDGTGGWYVSSDPLSLVNWAATVNPKILTSMDAEHYSFSDETTSSVFINLRRMFDENCAWSGQAATPYEYFAGRRALFYSGTSEDILQQMAANQRLGSGDQWTVLTYPSGDQKPVALVSGISYAIPSSTPEEQLAAWIFIHWMAAPVNQTRIVRASGSISTSVSALTDLQDFQQFYPQWSTAAGWMPIAQPAPRRASWIIAKNILEDAGWQLFRLEPTPYPVPAILEQIDQTIPDALKH